MPKIKTNRGAAKRYKTNGSGKIVRNEIARSYTRQGVVAVRLNRLLSLRELRLVGDSYVIDRGLLIIPAKLVFFLHGLLFPREKSG